MTGAHSTLRDVLRSDGRLSFERATAMLADLADALGPVHATGQAHGALTPQSVHLDADGRAGLGPPVADTTATGLLPPAYLAPERIAGEPADPRSDVYALGLIGWEMLTGQTPWSGESLHDVVLHQQERDLPALPTIRPGIPDPLLHAIEGALYKAPADRWPTASALRAALGELPTRVAPQPAVDEPRAAEAPITVTPSSVTLSLVTQRDEVPSDRSRGIGPDEPVPPDAVPPFQAGPPPRRRLRATERHGRLYATAAAAVIVLAGGATLLSLQTRSEARDTAPWMDSIATAASAGVLIVDATADSNAARVRPNRRASSLARAMALGDSATLDSTIQANARRDSTVSSAASTPDSAIVRADTAAAKRDTVPVRPDTTVPVKPTR